MGVLKSTTSTDSMVYLSDHSNFSKDNVYECKGTVRPDVPLRGPSQYPVFPAFLSCRVSEMPQKAPFPFPSPLRRIPVPSSNPDRLSLVPPPETQYPNQRSTDHGPRPTKTENLTFSVYLSHLVSYPIKCILSAATGWVGSGDDRDSYPIGTLPVGTGVVTPVFTVL